MSTNQIVYKLMKRYRGRLIKRRYQLNASSRASAFEKAENEKKLKTTKKVIKRYFRKEIRKERKAAEESSKLKLARKRLALYISNQNRSIKLNACREHKIERKNYQWATRVASETRMSFVTNVAKLSGFKVETETESESESENEEELASVYSPSGGSNSDSTIATVFDMMLRKRKSLKTHQPSRPVTIILSSDEEFDEIKKQNKIKRVTVDLNRN